MKNRFKIQLGYRLQWYRLQIENDINEAVSAALFDDLFELFRADLDDQLERDLNLQMQRVCANEKI